MHVQHVNMLDLTFEFERFHGLIFRNAECWLMAFD